MDSTELHYVNYDPEKTWDEMMRAYIAAGGDILWPGDEKEILLRSVLACTTATMAKVDNAIRMATWRYATGEYLKVYGENKECEYMEAVEATAPVTITFRAGGTPKTIPAGRMLTADGSVIYLLTEDIQQTGTAQTVNTTVQCQIAGTIGNGLNAGSQLQFVESVDGFISAIVSEDASGGMDAEDMEAYRERIRTSGPGIAGSYRMYESLALSVSPQVTDAKALNEGAGNVGVYIIVASGANSDNLISSVVGVLSPETARPLNDHVTVALADTVPYALYVRATFSTGNNGQNGVSDAVAAYQAWQEQKIGRAFDPFNLIARLYSLGAERVEILEGSGIITETEEEPAAEEEQEEAEEEEAEEEDEEETVAPQAVYTSISENAHCVGTVEVTVVSV